MSDDKVTALIRCSGGEVACLILLTPDPPPESIQAAFREVMARLGKEGPVTPERLVEDAKDPNSPLHHINLVTKREQ